MSGGGLLFLAIGAVSLLAGLAVMAAALRHQTRAQPKGVAMLIGGMMATAFGLMLGGFAIGYAMSASPTLNTQGAN